MADFLFIAFPPPASSELERRTATEAPRIDGRIKNIIHDVLIKGLQAGADARSFHDDASPTSASVLKNDYEQWVSSQFSGMPSGSEEPSESQKKLFHDLAVFAYHTGYQYGGTVPVSFERTLGLLR